MNSNNGHGKDRILSLDEARKPSDKGKDLITRAECYQIVAAECGKVHEFYLAQIPPHVARMIQDALMAYGLIQLTPEAAGAMDIAPAEATVADAESPETRESIASLDDVHDTNAPPEPAA